MSSIRDFAKENIQKNEKINDIPKEKLNKTKADYSDLIDLFMNKYGSLSEDELINEMLKLIEKKKQEGTFDGQKLKELAQRVAPFLDSEQRAKMYNLMRYLD